MSPSDEADAEDQGSANDVLTLEIAAGGTQFSAQKASPDSQAAYETLWDGDLWMIYRNANTSVLHWDFVSTDMLSWGGASLTPFRRARSTG